MRPAMPVRPGMTDHASARPPAPDPCWRTIGVMGDGSCDALAGHLHCRNCPVFAQAAEFVLQSAPRATDTDTGADPDSEQTLAAIAEPAARPARSRRALSFRVGTTWLALDIAWVRQIAPAARPHAVPHRTGKGLAGLVNVQGQLLLAVDLRRLLGEPAEATPAAAPMPSHPDARPRLVVVQFESEVWAFGADDIAGVVALPEQPSAQPPPTLRPPLSDLAGGLYDREGGHQVLLEPDALRATLASVLAA
jgi:chemotaxis-related protein WspD